MTCKTHAGSAVIGVDARYLTKVQAISQHVATVCSKSMTSQQNTSKLYKVADIFMMALAACIQQIAVLLTEHGCTGWARSG